MKEIILAIIGSGAFSGVVAAIIASVQSRSMMRNALKSILYYQIKEGCEKAISKGSITCEDLKASHEAWDTYHNKLDGNGYLNALMNKIDNLPIED